MHIKSINSVKNKINSKSTINHMELMEWCVNGKPLTNEEYEKYILNDVLESISILPKDELLDLGCGCGYQLKYFEKNCKSALGVEISQKLIKNKICKSHIVESDILEFNTGRQFNKIICYSVAVLFPDMNYFFNAIEKIIFLLKPKGVAIIGDLQWRKHDYYLVPDWNKLIQFLSGFDNVRFNINSQSLAKKSINSRLNLVLRKR